MAVLKSTTDGVIWAKVNGQQGARGPVGSSGPAAVGRNRIINGDFSVNQRGFTSASIVGVNYMGVDRWQGSGGGGTITYSVQTTTPGELSESALNYARIAVSGHPATTSDYSMLFQYIESVRTLSDKTITVSFWARAASGTPKVAVEIQRSYGSSGSPSPREFIPGGAVTISTVWNRYSLTLALPSIAGKTINTDSSDVIMVCLWTSSGSNWAVRSSGIPQQSNTIDFWGVQVEEGTFASSYEKRHYWHELRDCQRYFQRWAQPPLRGAIAGANVLSRIAMPLPVAMHHTPIATISGSLYVWDAAAGTTISVITGQYNHPQAIEFDANTPAVWGATGRPVLLYQTPGTGYLDVSAEI